MAPHDKDILSRQLDVDVLAVRPGHLAVQLVRLLRLADVEAWSRTASVTTPTGRRPVLFLFALHLARVRVEVIEEAEEGGEVGIGRVEVFRKRKDHFDVFSSFSWLLGGSVGLSNCKAA